MSDLSPWSLWRKFLALPNDSYLKVMGVAFIVSLLAATAVSVTAIALKPRQQMHLEAAREAKLATMIAKLPGLSDLLREAGVETLDAIIIELESGLTAADKDASGFDFISAQTDPAQSTALVPEDDIAGIGRRPNHAPVYLLRSANGLELVVLPVYGNGYQSVIRAYLALKGDLNTIAGLSIYEQSDTPGIGSRVTDSQWLDSWAGKQITDSSNVVAIKLVRSNAASPLEVDGITGATRSSNGVMNLVRFWMGDKGYGPFLTNLKNGAL